MNAAIEFVMQTWVLCVIAAAFMVATVASLACKPPTTMRPLGAVGWVAGVLCIVLGFSASMILVEQTQAHAISIDPTDNKVTKQEARYTYVGEFRSDVHERIGPVDRVGWCAPSKERCHVDYRLYGSWQREELWRVWYFRPGLPFTDQKESGPMREHRPAPRALFREVSTTIPRLPLQVEDWSFVACYPDCGWDR